jgi:hypothetical protein
MNVRIVAAAAAAVLAAPAACQPQGQSQEKLRALRAEKLAKPVFEGWLTDYDAARARARKDGKLILAYFTRSYAG